MESSGSLHYFPVRTGLVYHFKYLMNQRSATLFSLHRILALSKPTEHRCGTTSTSDTDVHGRGSKSHEPTPTSNRDHWRYRQGQQRLWYVEAAVNGKSDGTNYFSLPSDTLFNSVYYWR